MKKVIIFLGFLILLFVGFVLFRTFTYADNNHLKNKETPKIDVDDSSIEHLIQSIKIPVINSKNYEDTDFSQHYLFKEFLMDTYPEVFENLDFMTINYYSLLFKWKGTNPNLKPVLFTGHYDVVDADKSSLDDWKFNPFEGNVEDGKIYGRGTLDDRGSVIAMFEAISKLIKEGYQPERDIYFGFGHDEETGGDNGAKAISEYLFENNIKMDMVLDEGGRVEFSKNNAQNAYIGISEKGRLLVKIKFRAAGAHASRPPKRTSVTMLADAVRELNKNQYPPILISQVKEYYKLAFNNYDLVTKILIANQDIFKYFLFKKLEQNPFDNAYIRSTTALTQLKGFDSSNAVPSVAILTLDSRILPTQSTDDMLNHIKNVLNKKFKKDEFEIEIISQSEPSKISNIESDAYKKLSSEINKMFPNAKVIPYLIPAGTDAEYYGIISDNVYRFLPILIQPEEYSLMHGVNEYISVENYSRMIEFYKRFIKENF